MSDEEATLPLWSTVFLHEQVAEPDPYQEQLQALEPIKISLRNPISSRPESNARVSSSLLNRSTASGPPLPPASNPATIGAPEHKQLGYSQKEE